MVNKVANIFSSFVVFDTLVYSGYEAKFDKLSPNMVKMQ
ncbi:hypothetical protein LNTAR_10731 [Lentisphaera araneosa HTCC2155]|uniref:Uncharacterized protein n=1 Tax=Lentisphaera araneosa HTCC2155 TaxID=313628 RepID=A6DIU9_9BACT|nr:hypothetical protein LNTAR_10731 [Lentisphaera araneosa HTCC2155]